MVIRLYGAAMTLQWLSLLVAALAIVASAVIQFVTIRESRRNTISTLRASLFEKESAVLREALAEHLSLTYQIDAGYRHAMRANRPWPGELLEVVEREDRLYNLIRLELDQDREGHDHLLEAIDRLRAEKSEDPWTDRRDAVVEAAVGALRADVRRALD
jgi:hypothetical protein